MKTRTNPRRIWITIGLIALIIFGSWALFSTRLRFGSLIRQSRDILSKETKSVERLDNPGQESG